MGEQSRHKQPSRIWILDPRSKVASVRNRAVNRRISAAELEILMDGEKRSVENEEKSPIPENRLKPQPNTQCKPVPSPKVYSSVAAMKRSSAPQPLKTGSTSTLSSSSSPSDQERLSTFESNSNLSLILDDEDNRENSRKKATVCPEENNRHTNKVRKLSLRPKTPPPPPPTCEKTEDDTSNISHVENSEATTSFNQNPFIKENSRNSHRSRQKLEPSTGDFATDLKNALAKRRQKMGESSGISTLQLSSTEHESDDNHSQASSLTLSPPSARGEDASTNPESDNQGQNAVTLDHAVSGSVAASSARDSGYTSSRNSLEKNDDIIVTSFSSKSSSLWAEKSVDRWTVEEVGFWLDSLYLSEYKRNFLRAEVDGARLLQFCRADFAKMGLTRIAHRLTIENALKSRKRFSPDASSRRL
uniref:SAM domain-containing protein n=1 Tax=Romanomermis culicivorax TaxID=13658 RepID=A0A915KI83_ROMCU